jgi:hypothetical protein
MIYSVLPESQVGAASMADEAAAKDPSATVSASVEHIFDAVAAGNLVEVFPRPLS